MEIGDEIVEVSGSRLFVAFESEELLEPRCALAKNAAVSAFLKVAAHLGGEWFCHAAVGYVIVQLLCSLAVHVFHYHK